MMVIWGMTPEARVLRRKISPYPARESMPSWMRAPPESLIPTTGAPIFDGVVHNFGDFLSGDL